MRSQVLVAAWLGAAFAASAISDPAILAGALAAALALLGRGAGRPLRRVAATALLPTVALAAASWAWLWLAAGARPAAAPVAALALRAALVAFLGLSMLQRVALFRALAPFPALTRLLVVTLAQIHALRLLATDSLLGLRSRLPRRPRALDVLRGSGGITGALLALSVRNARDVSEAMRSRGF